MFTRDELAAIAALAINNDLLVVTDEVYEHLVFDGEHVPIVSFPGMRERTVRISSAGKTFAFTGWEDRLGHGHPRAGHRGQDDQAVPHLRQRRRLPVRDRAGPGPARLLLRHVAKPTCKPSATCSPRGLAEIGFEVYPPQGTYFVLTDISPLGERDGLEFCRTLPERAGVVAIPSALFYDHQEVARTQVRFAFCKRPEVLTQALDRLKAFSAERSVVPAPPKR